MKRTYTVLTPPNLLDSTIALWTRVVGQCEHGYCRRHGSAADVQGSGPDGDWLVKIRRGPKHLRCCDYVLNQ